MKELRIKKYVLYLFGIGFLLFGLNKFYLRPWVLENQTYNSLTLFVYSLPNFIEAIFGVLILTGILLHLSQYFKKKLGQIKESTIHLFALILASIYVLSQELKWHDLGGNNVYDPYDMIASIIGLIMTFGLIRLFGFLDEAKSGRSPH